MVIYMGLNSECVNLYEMQVRFNNFSVVIHILIHMIILSTYIRRMNGLRYNYQSDVWDRDKTPSGVKPHNLCKRI